MKNSKIIFAFILVTFVASQFNPFDPRDRQQFGQPTITVSPNQPRDNGGRGNNDSPILPRDVSGGTIDAGN